MKNSGEKLSHNNIKHDEDVLPTDGEKKNNANYQEEFLKQAKDQISAREKMQKKTDKFFGVGRWIYWLSEDRIEWSSEAYSIFDYPKDSTQKLEDYFFSRVKITESINHNIPSDLFTKATNHKEETYSFKAKGKGRKLISYSSENVFDDAGNIVAIEGMIKDLSDAMIGTIGLDNFFNLSQDLHCIAHVDGYFLKVSPAWIDLLGYTEEELLEKPFMELIHPDDIESTAGSIEELEEQGEVYKFVNRYITKTGEIVHLSWSSRTDPVSNLTFCNAKDITENKLVREQLLSKLNSKDLLLREIHHRVKNNLQIISSILSLQARINHEEVYLRRLYLDSQNRIQSMAAIHEMFYQSEELDKIDFIVYLRKLISDLTNSLFTETNNIDFSIDADSVFVNLDTAVPLGLLINEMVTNSVKHGQDADGNVNINVKVKKKEGNKVFLRIEDKGVNANPNILVEDSEDDIQSLGVLLINSLVDQLDGKIEQVESEVGAIFEITFENKLD
ncbi:sensor histidine kinase [Brumimicrobium aurantiacum]|uniref:histidine kinase n=1 Tax=Brumimicrobium aurantiacum TaxID=1737063 RepID=A0A3E1EYE8_9FLAO|nr:histidine kinase dimerization/phosphoacceptor domain -containing protein [Brumimicrobium aurantiacum]RFC54568.1 PAS domain S-box protein [Brumimicrobium aurantiacum]